MNDYLTFEGQIVPMPWGNSVFTVLPIPDEISHSLASQGAKRVEGEIGDYPVNLSLTKAPVIDQTFVYTGKSLLDAAGIEPGDIVEVRFRMANPAIVETPEDVTFALRQAGVMESWSGLSAGKKRGHLHLVNSAKRADTRSKRIAKLIAELRK